MKRTIIHTSAAIALLLGIAACTQDEAGFLQEGAEGTPIVFTGERPDNIRSGQTYYINLELGQPTESIIIPRGTFFQSTGGSWIFVLDKDGKKAYRRKIKIGRQNPQYYEVIDGLEAGEKVIVSSYESYKDNEVLVLE